MDLKKVVFENSFNLSFGAAIQKRTYGFSYENFLNDILKDQIHYEIEVDFLEDNSGRTCIFEINRKQVYLNNKVPNSKIEQIVEKASQAIFPLRIKMNTNGEIEEIMTSKTLEKRWFSAKDDILKYYKGETISKVISKIENVLLNDDLLKKSIHQNWFFHLYFKPFYTDYTEKLRFKHIWESPVFGPQFIQYGVVHTINEHYDQDGKISINADGIAIDERSIDEIKEGYNFPKAQLSGETVETVESKMNVDYRLYKEDRSVFSAIGTFITKIDENTQRKIQVELYHFPEKSSFKPWSDVALKESKRIFQSYQNKEEDDIIDIVSVSKKQHIQHPKPERIIGLPPEINQFYIPEEPDPVEKISFWNSIKSSFKKK